MKLLLAALAVAGSAALVGPLSAAGPSSAPAAASKAAHLETVPGKAVKQVVLSAKAAERAGIEQAAVEERPVLQTQMFGAMVVDAATSGNDKSGAKALALRVGVAPGEATRIDRTKPARVLTLETRPKLTQEVLATPMEAAVAATETIRSGMNILFYALPADAPAFPMGSRVRTELQLQGSGETRKTVPYSSILYDAKGEAWVYVVTAPLKYIRERVDIERIVGERAVIAKGPDTGTPVVTVGVSLLYGVEVFGK